MVNTEVKLRWALISLNVSASTFCVQDNLRNKHRFFLRAISRESRTRRFDSLYIHLERQGHAIKLAQ